MDSDPKRLISEAPSTTGETILVVDDEPHNAAIVQMALNARGYWAVTCSGGREAIEAILASPPSLVVLDVMMPDMSGFEVIQEIRSRPDLADLPVILLTARAEVPDRLKGFALGADDYVTRPFTMDELIARIEAALRKQRRISCLSKELDEMSLRSVTDELTQVRNRRYLMERAADEVSRSARTSQPLSCVMFDIDHFKAINDTLGHAVGDAVLREVAGRLASSARNSDVLARYGGEEFCLLLPDTSLEGAEKLAEKARFAVSGEPVVTQGNRVTVTISGGCSAGAPRRHGADVARELIRRADMALLEAKRRGRNQVVTFARLVDGMDTTPLPRSTRTRGNAE
ncbi:MAG: diguanylate cyclase [Candidatus Schekmanbacteria bacterium]|nr:diguanylate cyclase [Candidatus Schekmanbacteria bacterium]